MQPLPTLVQTLVGIKVDDIAAGLAHTLVSSKDGDVYRLFTYYRLTISNKLYNLQVI